MTVIGTAAWSISRAYAGRFSPEGSSLARYASVFDGVEINSSFYKRHKPETWLRWAESVSEHFRFSVKVPKHITHELRLTDAESAVDEFRQDAGLLGARLGPVLLQLPPNLAFSEKTVAAFLDHFRPAFVGRIVIEPRHPTWATAEASALLLRYRIDRVTADPAVISQGKTEKGEFAYFRLHGAPKIYYSSYSAEQLRTYRDTLSVASADSWCIFDNTASGAALANALEMLDLDYT